MTRWTEANTSLSLSAQEARAKTQGVGRGLGGFLGKAARASAAASNARIAQDVAAKRIQIAEGKRQAQEHVREIQTELADAKQELKALQSSAKTKAPARASAAKAAGDPLTLLLKLRDARDAGLLTEEEFEEKRKKLVDSL